MYEEKRIKLVNNLKEREYIKTTKIEEAFLNVPRENFIPSKVEKRAYADKPLPIGQGQTISAPSMIAIMLEVLDLKKDQKILEIGTGSGYNAALLAEIIGPDGIVYTVERLEKVAEVGRKNLENEGYENVEVVVEDGTKGYEERSPYDRILVTACAPKIPDSLVSQIDKSGKIAIPSGKHYMSQILKLVEKDNEGNVNITDHGGCSFVPLVGEQGWDREKSRR